jgi:hypothetical protein
MGPEMTGGGVVDKCYAKDLNSCGGSLSREHFISQNILHRIGTISSRETLG